MKHERGFTITEVVVSIMLISVGALGIAQATAGMTRMLSRGDQATTASMLAQDQMERLRAVPCANLSYGTRIVQNVYTLDWSVTTAPNVRRILLTANYPAGGTVRTDTFQTTVPCI